MLLLALAIASMLQPVQQFSTMKEVPPVEVFPYEAHRHRIGDDWLLVRIEPKGSQQFGFETIAVEVIVDSSGAVVSATAHPPERRAGASSEMLTKAEALVRGLRFKPFERGGHAVTAKFTEQVSLVPAELKPAHHVPFPRVKDWKTVRIALTRTTCYGTCPAYSVEVQGDGSVFYEGKRYVAFTGNHRGLISRDNVIELVKLFEQVDFFSLQDEYSVGGSDIPTYVISIEVDGRRKQVVDYGGVQAGIPMVVSELEQAIDRLSGSERWTQGNEETMTALESEHWDFKSAEAAATLARVAQYGNAAVVRGLASAGVPLNGKGEHRVGPLVESAHRGDVVMLRALLDAGAAADPQDITDAVFSAVAAGNMEALRLLLSQGGHLNLPGDLGRRLLMAATTSGSPAMVTEVLKSHPDVNVRIACDGCHVAGRTALMEVATDSFYEVDPDVVVEIAQLLIQAGADVNARDKEGNTALILSAEENDQLALLLIQAGADVNARNDKGSTALSVAHSDDLKRLLIEHGAVPQNNKNNKDTEDD